MAMCMYFYLYVAGDAPHSLRSIVNLKRFCAEKLPGHHQIEIIDLFVHPERALRDNVLLTPTLTVKIGTSVRRIVGDLSDTSALSDLVAQQGSL
jgi:circadian clock protein KaiB